MSRITDNEQKAYDIAVSAGHNNPAFFTGLLMAIEKSPDTPKDIAKTLRRVYTEEYISEMDAGYRFYNNIVSLI